MPWDVNRAIHYLQANAQPTSTKECAKYTRKAIEAGGIRLINTRHAKDYGPSLTKSGFRQRGHSEQEMLQLHNLSKDTQMDICVCSMVIFGY